MCGGVYDSKISFVYDFSVRGLWTSYTLNRIGDTQPKFFEQKGHKMMFFYNCIGLEPVQLFVL